MIARDGEYLVFCEVKYRSGGESGHPLEAVDSKKQRVLSKCALYYLAENGYHDIPCRFDVVGIFGDKILVVKDGFDFR